MMISEDNLKKDPWDEELLGEFSSDLPAEKSVPTDEFKKTPFPKPDFGNFGNEEKKSLGAKKIKTFLPFPAKKFLLPAASSVIAAMLIAGIFTYTAPAKNLAENGVKKIVESADSVLFATGDLTSNAAALVFDGVTNTAGVASIALGSYVKTMNSVGNAYVAGIGVASIAATAAMDGVNGLSASVLDAVSGFFKTMFGSAKSALCGAN